jgi:DNA-binding MarR family transcriptional regulator
MTNRIDRLSARGLVERYPDPDDRRGVIVRLTGEGKDAVDAAFTALLDAERTLLEDLPERDRTRLASLLRQLLAPFHARETEPVRASRRAGDRAD